jgi:DNA-binding NarL/FixJ family response regulator
MMTPVRVLLVDDHTLVRAGIRSLLDAMEGFNVVAEASDGREALALARAHQPDIVVMDIAMKDLNGLETTVQIKRDFPGTRVIILSMHGTGDYVQQAIRAGASGYLMKDAATAELGIALQAVMRGEVYLSPAASKQVVESYMLRPGADKQAEQLTPRQREVLQMIAEGLSTKEIAYRMGVSVKTVETHRTQLMERLDIRDVAGLVRYAIRIGLVSADKK